MLRRLAVSDAFDAGRNVCPIRIHAIRQLSDQISIKQHRRHNPAKTVQIDHLNGQSNQRPQQRNRDQIAQQNSCRRRNRKVEDNRLPHRANTVHPCADWKKSPHLFSSSFHIRSAKRIPTSFFFIPPFGLDGNSAAACVAVSAVSTPVAVSADSTATPASAVAPPPSAAADAKDQHKNPQSVVGTPAIIPHNISSFI